MRKLTAAALIVLLALSAGTVNGLRYTSEEAIAESQASFSMPEPHEYVRYGSTSVTLVQGLDDHVYIEVVNDINGNLNISYSSDTWSLCNTDIYQRFINIVGNNVSVDDNKASDGIIIRIEGNILQKGQKGEWIFEPHPDPSSPLGGWVIERNSSFTLDINNTNGEVWIFGRNPFIPEGYIPIERVSEYENKK